MRHRTRSARLAALIDHFQPTNATTEVALAPSDRFVAIELNDDEHAVVPGECFETVCETLGCEVLEGWTPLAVYNLDTGEAVDVSVSTPTVSRSCDQGATFNPLALTKSRPTPSEFADDLAERDWAGVRQNLWVGTRWWALLAGIVVHHKRKRRWRQLREGKGEIA